MPRSVHWPANQTHRDVTPRGKNRGAHELGLGGSTRRDRDLPRATRADRRASAQGRGAEGVAQSAPVRRGVWRCLAAPENPSGTERSDDRRFLPRNRSHVTLMGSGSGSVSGGGLTCTGALGQTCSGTCQAGDVITLSASAGTGDFTGWGDACGGTGACTVTMSTATLVVATFNLPPPTVTQFYHLDVLGSVRAVTGVDGAVLRRHDYAPFGEELHTEEAEPGLPYVAKQQRF